MSIQQAMIAWLRGFVLGGGIFENIGMNRLAAGETAGLFKMPQVQETDFVNGSHDVNEHYTLLIRLDNTTKAAHRENCELAEALKAWIRAQNAQGRLPELDGGRLCHAVRVGKCKMEQGAMDAMIHMEIGVSYYAA